MVVKMQPLFCTGKQAESFLLWALFAKLLLHFNDRLIDPLREGAAHVAAASARCRTDMGESAAQCRRCCNALSPMFKGRFADVETGVRRILNAPLLARAASCGNAQTI